MKKAYILALWFLSGSLMLGHAIAHNFAFGMVMGAATLGGCFGYLIGRIDLRHELGAPRS